MKLTDVIHRDFPYFHGRDTVEQVLEHFRKYGLKHKVFYVYVVDEDKALIGVVPIRRLLSSESSTSLTSLMILSPIAASIDSSFEEVRALMSEHKFLALPVIGKDRELLGVVDIEEFAGDLGDLSGRMDYNGIYELLGFQISAEESKRLFGRFLLRFPWLLSSVAAGSAAAIITSLFQKTLQEAVVISFFLALVLGLNESIAMQSTHIAIQRLHGQISTKNLLYQLFRRELTTGIALAFGTALLVLALSYLWFHNSAAACVLGATLVLSMTVSNLIGVLVPGFFHRLSKDPRIASAPLALALSDIFALLIYLSLAAKAFS